MTTDAVEIGGSGNNFLVADAANRRLLEHSQDLRSRPGSKTRSGSDLLADNGAAPQDKNGCQGRGESQGDKSDPPPLDFDKLFGKKQRPAGGAPGSLEWLKQNPGVFRSELPQNCRTYPVFDQIIDKAVRNYYDPARFGNLAELKKKACDLGDPSDKDSPEKQLRFAHA